MREGPLAVLAVLVVSGAGPSAITFIDVFVVLIEGEGKGVDGDRPHLHAVFFRSIFHFRACSANN